MNHSRRNFLLLAGAATATVAAYRSHLLDFHWYKPYDLPELPTDQELHDILLPIKRTGAVDNQYLSVDKNGRARLSAGTPHTAKVIEEIIRLGAKEVVLAQGIHTFDYPVLLGRYANQVTIRGERDKLTIIDCEDKTSAFLINGESPHDVGALEVKFEDLVIRNGNAGAPNAINAIMHAAEFGEQRDGKVFHKILGGLPTFALSDGGALGITGPSHVTAKRLHFVNNRSIQCGGAIWLNGSGALNSANLKYRARLTGELLTFENSRTGHTGTQIDIQPHSAVILKNCKIIGSLNENVETSHITVFDGSIFIAEGLDIDNAEGNTIETLGRGAAVVKELTGQRRSPAIVVRSEIPKMAESTYSALREALAWRNDYVEESNQTLIPVSFHKQNNHLAQQASDAFWEEFSQIYPVPEQLQKDQLIRLISEKTSSSFDLANQQKLVSENMNFNGSPKQIEYWVLLKIALQVGVKLPKSMYYPIRNYASPSLYGSILVDGSSLLGYPNNVEPILFDYNSRSV
ncbi:MAG: hypothetical protein ABW098_06960 [Candidatus Thiodiazotropha sp.]